MATYNQVSYGSRGSDVTELQKLLNNNGYKLATDGVFGSQTQKAVRDYQQKNSLAVDGIVGSKTWGSLAGGSASSNGNAIAGTTGGSSGTASSAGNTLAGTNGGTASSNGNAIVGTTGGNQFSYTEYKPSDAVIQAQKMLEEQLAGKPGDYQSTWQAQLNDTLQQILNREKFSYDLNADALYQQYKDQYVTQGKMAMMDTMGQAQAMTGGYGNSYAQSVGQQAYQGHLQELNNKIPELYQLAMSKYQMEGDALTDQYALLAQQEQQDYGRYRDQLGDWQTERDFLTGRYDSERDYDYGKWADGRDFTYNKFSDDRSYNYQVERDKADDDRWQKEFDEAKRQFDQQHGVSSGSSGGGSSGGSGGSGGSSGGYTKNPGLSKAEILSIQKQAGISQDGIWGPNTAAAYDKGIRPKDGPVGDTGDDTEARMQSYVKRMLDNATSSQFNPKAVINGNSSLTSKEKAVALEILNAYISSGYMKF